MRHGRLIAESTPDALAGGDTAEAVISFCLPLGVDQMSAGPVRVIERRRDRLTLATGHPTVALQVLTAWAVERGVELWALTATRPSLEEVYLELTENKADTR